MILDTFLAALEANEADDVSPKVVLVNNALFTFPATLVSLYGDSMGLVEIVFALRLSVTF